MLSEAIRDMQRWAADYRRLIEDAFARGRKMATMESALIQAERPHDIERIAAFADKHDGDLTIARMAARGPGSDQRWSIALHWGQEAPDSPMVGAASYGIGETLEEAAKQVAEEVRA